jgi:hypothetical protein
MYNIVMARESEPKSTILSACHNFFLLGTIYRRIEKWNYLLVVVAG